MWTPKPTTTTQAQSLHFCTATTIASRNSTSHCPTKIGAQKHQSSIRSAHMGNCVVECFSSTPHGTHHMACRPRYFDGSGILRVCGGKDLKQSQHYPKLFGAAVAQLFAQEKKHIKTSMKDIAQLDKSQGCEQWRVSFHLLIQNIL